MAKARNFGFGSTGPQCKIHHWSVKSDSYGHTFLLQGSALSAKLCRARLCDLKNLSRCQYGRLSDLSSRSFSACLDSRLAQANLLPSTVLGGVEAVSAQHLSWVRLSNESTRQDFWGCRPMRLPCTMWIRAPSLVNISIPKKIYESVCGAGGEGNVWGLISNKQTAKAVSRLCKKFASSEWVHKAHLHSHLLLSPQSVSKLTTALLTLKSLIWPSPQPHWRDCTAEKLRARCSPSPGTQLSRTASGYPAPTSPTTAVSQVRSSSQSTHAPASTLLKAHPLPTEG